MTTRKYQVITPNNNRFIVECHHFVLDRSGVHIFKNDRGETLLMVVKESTVFLICESVTWKC
jgi:hypothetical protein